MVGRCLPFLFACLSCLALSIFPLYLKAQKGLEAKPFEDWSQAEVRELLQNSPWVRYCMADQPYVVKEQLVGTTGKRIVERSYSTAWVVRLLTAKPIREAYLRKLSFLEPGLSINARTLAGESSRKAELDRLQRFIRSHPNDVLVRSDPEHIVVCLAYSVGIENGPDYQRPAERGSQTSPEKSLIPAKSEIPLPKEMRHLSLSGLAPASSLSTSAGKKAHLVRYELESPASARFYFPRNTADGRPLLADGDKELRFETRFGKTRIVAEFPIVKLFWKGRAEF